MSQPHISHRFHERLVRYWDNLRGARGFPKESDIDPDDIEDIWDSCFLISNDDVTKRIGYRYSYLGKDLIAAFGDDMTQHDAALRLLSTSKIPNSRKFDQLLETKQIVHDDGDFINLMGINIRYRACLLPLGENADEVSHILGCMRWRSY